MMDYVRPALTDEEQVILLRCVAGFFTRRRQDQIRVLAALLVENATLAAEVNQLRAALGIDPLPMYKPFI